MLLQHVRGWWKLFLENWEEKYALYILIILYTHHLWTSISRISKLFFPDYKLLVQTSIYKKEANSVLRNWHFLIMWWTLKAFQQTQVKWNPYVLTPCPATWKKFSIFWDLLDGTTGYHSGWWVPPRLPADWFDGLSVCINLILWLNTAKENSTLLLMFFHGCTQDLNAVFTPPRRKIQNFQLLQLSSGRNHTNKLRLHKYLMNWQKMAIFRKPNLI